MEAARLQQGLDRAAGREYDLPQDAEEQRGRNHDDRGDGRQAEEKDPEDAG